MKEHVECVAYCLRYCSLLRSILGSKPGRYVHCGVMWDASSTFVSADSAENDYQNDMLPNKILSYPLNVNHTRNSQLIRETYWLERISLLYEGSISMNSCRFLDANANPLLFLYWHSHDCVDLFLL